MLKEGRAGASEGVGRVSTPSNAGTSSTGPEREESGLCECRLRRERKGRKLVKLKISDRGVALMASVKEKSENKEMEKLSKGSWKLRESRAKKTSLFLGNLLNRLEDRNGPRDTTIPRTAPDLIKKGKKSFLYITVDTKKEKGTNTLFRSKTAGLEKTAHHYRRKTDQKKDEATRGRETRR